MSRKWRTSIWAPIGGLALLAAACGAASEAGPDRAVAPAPQAQAGAQAAAPSAAQAEAAPEPRPGLFLPESAGHTPQGDAIIRGPVDPRELPWGEWRTNWEVRIVELDELDFLLARDVIPPIDRPRYVSIAEADSLYQPDTPVIQFAHNGDVRAFPLEIMTWHEIVNDVVGGDPVAVTFCPLCNSALAFDRRLGDHVLRFGTSGGLRNSDLVMWDDVSESLWQQIGGTALIGDFVGARLTALPASIVSWGQFKASFPEGIVLSRDTGFVRRYGENPYPGYDSVSRPPERFRGILDERLSPFERVVAVEFDEGAVAYPFLLLQDARVIHEQRDDEAIVVFWTPGTASALDLININDGREVGASGVFRNQVRGRALQFSPDPDDPLLFIDSQTASRWNIFGLSVQGALAGEQLAPLVHANHFWFAWAAFQPDTEIVLAAG